MVYFATGIAGSLASAYFSSVPSVGASGAIFGLMGALIAFLLRRRGALTPQGKSILMQLVGWAAINVFFGFSTPGIDNSAHLGGCAAGLLLGFVLPEPQARSCRRRPTRRGTRGIPGAGCNGLIQWTCPGALKLGSARRPSTRKATIGSPVPGSPRGLPARSRTTRLWRILPHAHDA